VDLEASAGSGVYFGDPPMFFRRCLQRISKLSLIHDRAAAPLE
jgi:hypothetical protein